MNNTNKKLGFGAALLVSLVAAAGSGKAQVVLSPTNMDGWYFGETDPNGVPANANPGDVAQFVNGPKTPPAGTGSAELSTATGAGDDGVFLSTENYDGTKLSSLTFSYATYVTVNNGQQFPYLQIGVNLNDPDLPVGAPTTDTLFFEPPYQTASTGNSSLPDQGTPALTTWQTWNATEGGFWDNNGNFSPGTGVGSLASFLALYPNATIAPAFTSATNQTIIGGLALTVGYGNSGETETGYVSDLTIGTSAGVTTFTFATPEPSTWAMLAGGLGLMLLRTLRLRSRFAATSPSASSRA